MSKPSINNQIPWWEITQNAFLGGKHYISLILIAVLLFLAYKNWAHVYAASKAELISKDAELSRRQGVVQSFNKSSGQKMHNERQIDLYTEETGIVEPTGEISIIATINSFGQIGAPDPTELLTIDNTEVLRPVSQPFVEGKTLVDKHRVTRVDTFPRQHRRVAVVLIFRHEDLFHKKYDTLLQTLENTQLTFSLMTGADILLSVYVAGNKAPSKDAFYQFEEKLAFAPADLSRGPFNSLLDDVSSHTGRHSTSHYAINEHVDYVLNRSLAFPNGIERVAAVILPAEYDKELKRTSELNQFVQFYKGNKNEEVYGPEREQYDLVSFTKAMNSIRKNGAPRAEMRRWAGQFAPGKQARYKVYWEPNEFDLSATSEFLLRFEYQHLDQRVSPTVRVVYVGKKRIPVE